MSHKMRPQSITDLLKWIINEYGTDGNIFGIHKSLFYRPQAEAAYASELFGNYLETPIGPAAGPNTQLTQNIVSSWLCGARFIELKTVQIMDELELGRPCIDMEDEGYNTEWSQELRLEQSIREYVKAWVLIPILRRMLGWENTQDGTIFNLSVGYNLEGILTPRMQKFIATMLDASELIAEYRNELEKSFPQYADFAVSAALTNSCTLSTMHGCPPDEIGRIAKYLLEERGFHLTVKLNPTLMGPDFVRNTLNETLGYREISIPAPVFEYDLKYPQAVEIIKALRESAAARGKFFGVKLSNTLAMYNYRRIMPGEEMYMSGRSLLPITVNLWNRLNKEFTGELKVSYSAGADAMNVADLLACGAISVTIASDILKPGGYARFGQCVENVEAAMAAAGAKNLVAFAQDKDVKLEALAAETLRSPRYKKRYFAGTPKVETPLGLFDCITAPCTAHCAVCQDVPAYALAISRGDFDGALRAILLKNPLPGLTGHVCTHLCETKCTRANYDEAVGIRALKRFVARRGNATLGKNLPESGRKVAVIGAGPSGLAAAAYLALAGVGVTVFEARSRAGGIMAIAPTFRLPQSVMNADVERIRALGVEFRFNNRVECAPEKLLNDGFDVVYVATGFPKDAPLGVPGDDAAGVWTSLDLLERVANGERPNLGRKVLVVGGGNTAVDAARTAQRLAGTPVMIVYRRTREEMPAIEEERILLFEEGNELVELAAPVCVVVKDGKAVGLECEKTKLGEPDASGRRRPEPTGEKFVIEADSIIAAIGQQIDSAIFRDTKVQLGRNGSITTACNGRTTVPGIYGGGDAVTGPAIVIQACADGRRAAEAICAELGLDIPRKQGIPLPIGKELDEIRIARARKAEPMREAHIPVAERKGFGLVEKTLSETEAVTEARRCLQCATVCGKCVEVCPNRANYAYKIAPLSAEVPILSVSCGEVCAVSTERFTISQGSQIVHIDDFCNECGNCAVFCVHEGRPYMEKPRLCLNDEDFQLQDDNVFRIVGSVLLRREKGKLERLEIMEGSYTYENDDIRVILDRGYGVKNVDLKTHKAGTHSLKSAMEMSAIYQGLKNSLPWLTK